MSAQDIMLGAQVLRLRDLKAEVSKLRAENTSLRDELHSLTSHFGQALLASADLRGLPEGGVLEIWDGWNLILGANRVAKDRDELLAQARAHVGSRPCDRVWIVLDGRDEHVTGKHRADRFIVDFVRMAAYLGLADRVCVRTNDRDFARQVRVAKGER